MKAKSVESRIVQQTIEITRTKMHLVAVVVNTMNIKQQLTVLKLSLGQQQHQGH